MSHKMAIRNLGVVLLAAIAAISAAFMVHRHFVTSQYRAQTEETRKLARTIDIQVIERLRGAAVAMAGSEWVERTASGDLGVDNPETLLILETTRSNFDAAVVYIMNAGGNVVACTPFGGGQTFTGKNYEFRPYFKEAMQGQAVLYPALGVTTYERGLYTSAPVYRRSDQHPTGVLVIKSGLDPLDQMLGEYRESLAMLSPEGVVFAANRPDWLFRLSRQTLTETERIRLRESRQFADQSLEGLPGGLNLVEGVTPIDGRRHGVVRVPIGITSAEGLSWELLSLRTYPVSSPIGLMLAVIVTIAVITIVVLLYLSSRRAGAELTREVSANREYLATILNSIGDAVIALDTRGVIRHMNPAGERLTGWSLAEAIGKPLEEVFRIVDTRTREPAVNLVPRVLETGEVSTLAHHITLVAREGVERQIADSVAPIRDSRGMITGAVVTFADVTEGYAAREALRDTTQRLRTIINATPDFVAFKGGKGHWLEANDACLELFRLPRDGFRGKTDTEVADDIHPQWRDAFLACMQTPEATWRKGALSRIEQVIPRPGGETKVYDVIQAPVLAPGGEREGMVVFGRDITERKLAEKALQEAHSRLDDIIEFLPDALFVIDCDGKVIAWNKAIEVMTGIPKAEMIGKGNHEYAIPFYGKRRPILIDLILIPDSEFVIENYKYVHRIGDTLFAETYVPGTYHGKGAYLSGKASKLRDDKGNIIGAIESILDITERKKAEDALLRSEQQYRDLYMNLRDGCAAVNTEGIIVACNNQFLSMTGYTFEEIKLLSYEDITPEKWHALEYRILQEQVNVRGYSDPYEKEYIRSDGTVFPVEVQTYLDGAGNGEIAAYWAIVRDIMERKRAEEALRNSEENYRRLFEESKRAEELYRSLLESSADAIIIYDMEGNVRFVSPSFTLIFGWTLDDLLGKRIPFVPEAEKEATMAEIRRVLAGNPCSNFETRRYDKNGRILHVTLSASRYDDHQGVPAGMLVILRDVTQTKALEAQYRQAQKMEAIGTLAGGVAHDFNNILQAITGYTQLLLWGKSGDDSGRHELMQIQKAGERATQLVRQLLTFSRKVEGVRRPLNLNQEVLEVEKVLRRTIPKMIAIELHLGSRLWGIHADQVQIEQILLNLVSNAADAMPEGGELVIETRNATLDDNYCRDHLGAMPGNYVLLSATDNGHGIDRETLQHIFEPFFTTKEVGKGTGLGLASVYGIVKSHGGYIQCSSEVGKGTTFEIYLPAIGHVDTLAGKETDATSLMGGSETILVVDDEASVRGLATQTLQQLGYTVIGAHSGESALAIYRAHKGRIALVILDLGMPGMGGHRCLRELKMIDPEARVVIASGYSDSSHEKASLESGALGFIGKPYELKDLAVQVRTFLDRKKGH